MGRSWIRGIFLIVEGLGSFLEDPHRVTAVTSDGTKFLVVWLEHYWDCIGFQTHEDMMAVTIDPVDPPALGAVHNLFSSAPQYGLAASVLGEGFWTAWFGRDRQNPEILGARRTSVGQLLDSEGIELEFGLLCYEQHLTISFSPPVATGNAAAALSTYRISEENLSSQMRVVYRMRDPSGEARGSGNFRQSSIRHQLSSC